MRFPTETIISILNFAMHQETIQINSCRYFCRWYQKLRNTNNTYEKWVLSRPGQAEYVAVLKEVTGMEKCSQNPRNYLRSSEIKIYEMYVQRVKDIFTEEFINPFSNEMDKTKLYNITSGTYTSNCKSECLLTILEREKIRMVEFKERISKNASNKYIFDPIKKKNGKVLKMQ